MIPLLIGAATAGALVALNRRRMARAVEAGYAARFPLDANGVANGAEGFVLPGTTGRGLLLLHGSGDSPQSLRYLADALHAAGYEVSAPLLPGHGRSPRSFADATAADYRAATASALAAVMNRNAWTGVIGLSMGAALAVEAVSASSHARVLVLLAPYMIPTPSVRIASKAALVWSPWSRYLRGRGEGSVHDPIARNESRAYGTFSKEALGALVATANAGYRALGRITVPTLVINSLADNRIPRPEAEQVLRAIKAPLEEHWLEGCGHIITVDYCRAAVAKLVLAFLAHHAG
ncbi:MAG: alpha/beta fold hydrolase [Gemmatimonadota bacterium]|nr:alpha/beta fold hydrolase [Gemmatimonadota bacterium]